MKVNYNSWEQMYKTPFGAVKAGAPVKWLVTVETEAGEAPVSRACLVLRRADGAPVFHDLQSTDGTHFRLTLPIECSGLYYYHFRIDAGNQHRFYGHQAGGAGQLVIDPNKVADYQLTVYEQDSPTVSWLDRAVMYQIFPDSFYNGNPNKEVRGRKPNSFLYATEQDLPYNVRNKDGSIARWTFYGGNLRGIITQLPYLKSLGVTVLYLNPIFEATSSHRYDTNDFMKIDSLLGDEETFSELVAKLHAAGMHLILDGVFNHVGEDSRYFNIHQLYGPGVGATQDKNSPYYDWFYFSKYPSEYKSWWGVTNLPEVNKDNPFYQRFIYGDHGVLDKWDHLGVDGWRLDVADELPMEFLRQLRQRQEKNGGHVLVGEVWEDASNKYVDGERRTYVDGDNLTGTMNYPAREFIIDLLRASDQAGRERAVNTYLQLVENYPAAFLRNSVNNIGTHDTVRIKRVLGEDEQKVALAFALMFALPGIPCVYYGDEAGLTGDRDPDNRRFFPWGRESEFLTHTVMHLSQLRKKEAVLTNGQTGLILGSGNGCGLVRFTAERVLIMWCNWSMQDWAPGDDQLEFFAVPAELTAAIKRKLPALMIPALAYRVLTIDLN